MSEDQTGALIAGAPLLCKNCNALLCLRKQVINLALGNADEMQCLVCLGRELETDPETVLVNTKEYLLGRDCFARQWVKYSSVEHCPEPLNCFPCACFK